MANAPKNTGLDLILAKQMINLEASIMALQAAIEAIARQVEGEDHVEGRFRKQIEETAAQCREKLLLDMENINPAVAAFLDENTPLSDGEKEEPR